jgi:hypothetical protein
VDSRDVTRGIRRIVWSVLREHGFTAFAGRTAWRYVGDAIDVVNFQSFSASLADAVGSTTFSFSVNLGVWLPADAHEEIELKRDTEGRLRPTEYQCVPHRRRLEKSLDQPLFKPFSSDTRRWLPALRLHRKGLKKVIRRDTHDRPDIWFVLPDGSNVQQCLEDVLQGLREDGLRWFQQVRDERPRAEALESSPRRIR